MQDPLQWAILALLAYAAWRDVAARIIPDALPAALLALGLAARAPLGAAAAAASLAAAALLLVLLLPLAMRGLLGGGDVKLAAAVAAGLPPAATWDFTLSSAVAGGALGLLYLLLAPLAPPLEQRVARGAGLLRRVAVAEARRIRRRGPLPYAVALGAGAALAMTRAPGA